MFDKKKLNFWRLAVLYAGFTIIVLFLLWSSPYKSKASMMTSSMGNMMKNMHMSNITVSGLLSNPSSQSQMADMAAHHENENSPIYKTAILTTGTVFLLLPLIIGGSIILAIIWIK